MSDDYKHQPPNLDLINMVQNARIKHDEDAVPSKAASMYWIEAKRQVDGPAPTARIYEFRITTHEHEVDAVWQRIKEATHAGELGYKSKVSTVPSDAGQSPDARTICVLTYDARDMEHIQQVADKLRALGIEDKHVTFSVMNLAKETKDDDQPV